MFSTGTDPFNSYNMDAAGSAAQQTSAQDNTAYNSSQDTSSYNPPQDNTASSSSQDMSSSSYFGNDYTGSSSSGGYSGGGYSGGGYSGGGGGGYGYAPVVLDIAGKGINITQLSSSNTFEDMTGDGYKNRTAWAGVGNGVLFVDTTGAGQLTQANQIIFTKWDPGAKSDMQALLDVFDTNHDGALDAGDASTIVETPRVPRRIWAFRRVGFEASDRSNMSRR